MKSEPLIALDPNIVTSWETLKFHLANSMNGKRWTLKQCRNKNTSGWARLLASANQTSNEANVKSGANEKTVYLTLAIWRIEKNVIRVCPGVHLHAHIANIIAMALKHHQ